MQLLKNQTQSITEEHLVSLYTILVNHGDKKQAQNTLDLYEKLVKNELIVSFTGHFSAGKSSIINDLLGKSLLPQSPIPTSANLVKIYSGNEGYARVNFRHANTIEYNEPYNIELIKEFAQEKDTIDRIEISSSEAILPSQTAIMDTPGIDAADDADRVITEGSLHVVDAMFYVMDYNHVQSEVNLQFLQAIQAKEIPFFLVINQIDKHNDAELPFSTYKNKIKQTFNQWGINPVETFYTSLLDDANTNNQLQELKDFFLKVLTTNKEDYYSINRSVSQIITEHEQHLEDQYNERIEILKDETSDLTSTTERIGEIEKQITKMENRPIEFEKIFLQNINTTLQNAYIMPAALRDQATKYLESKQQNFKIGLFGSKKKTDEEKLRRLQDFLQPLQENIEKSIQWKLRDKIIQEMKRFGVTDPILIQRVQKLSIEYTENDLEALINSGAMVNGEYVLNYTKDVTNDIKSKFKREIVSEKDAILASINNQNAEQLQAYENELVSLKKAENANQQIANLVSQLEEKVSKLHEVFTGSKPSETDWNTFKQTIKEYRQISKEDVPPTPKTKKEPVIADKHVELDKGNTHYSVEDVLQGINDTIDIVETVSGFNQIITDLKNKHRKLINRSFTITLFGAFSAGKSSFANALIGESVLPVSPNPTTAAINRIVPVTTEKKHGSVVVTLKDESTIINDCLALLRGFTPKSDSLESLYKWLMKTDIGSLSQTQQHYLQAIIDGYQTIKTHIGDYIQTNVDEFSVYVTDETKACFVESIDLYYDCSITQQGITLVDTPGADSVNARHTNVAFDYIKHADAILYVTYYNHALSRADKDFLMQLGRVKESFELDKMFFIINAADLAKDDNELSLVKNYVNEQLLQLGIRFTRLFPISSRAALANKQAKEPLNEYMFQFEEDFYQFIHQDLTKLSIDSALWDMERAFHAISKYVTSVKMSDDEKKNEKSDILAKKEKAFEQINNLDYQSYKQAITQKIDKQVFYVLERLSIRFHDMFKEMFNPTTIQKTGKAGKLQVENSMQELLDYVGYELLQELRAVSLRIEALIREQLDEIGSILGDKVKKIDSNFVLPNNNDSDLSTPNFQQAFDKLDATNFAKALSEFKGPKSFFEKNEKEQMKENIFAILKPHATDYLESNKEILENAYEEQWKQIIERLKVTYTQSIESYIEGFITILSDDTHDQDALINKENKLASIMKNFDKGDDSYE